MDRYTILDHGSSSPAKNAAAPSNGKVTLPEDAKGKGPDTVSARVAAANRQLGAPDRPLHAAVPLLAKLGFPGDDGGRSLAAMAEFDLDAALQLLAERAQYITGASGAAIALRRGVAHDMLCRASAGSNAPELGSLLSTEFGLSGESVRSRKVLRCDDAERDPRVNRDGCRQLGIASVVVMPIAGDEEVIGVFELFSGKSHAFNERDLVALERLGRMVETAVSHAVAAQRFPEAQPAQQIDIQPPKEKIEPGVMAASASAAPQPGPVPQDGTENARKPLLWSAAARAQGAGHPAVEAQPVTVPPVLRQLQKCQLCGFPVSSGRTLCVECENKQSGRRPTRPSAVETTGRTAVVRDAPHTTASASIRNGPTAEPKGGHAAAAIAEVPDGADNPASHSIPAQGDHGVIAETGPKDKVAETPALFLASAQQSESWLARNRFIVGVMLLIAITLAAVAWLR